MRLFHAFTVFACDTLLCLPAMCVQLAAASPPVVVTLENSHDLYPIRSAQVIVDKEKALSFEEIRRLETFKKMSNDIPFMLLAIKILSPDNEYPLGNCLRPPFRVRFAS